MAEGKGFKGCIVAVVWLVILAIVAVTVRYFWTEPQKEKLQSDTGSNSSYSHEVKIQADLFSGYSVLRSEEMKKNLSKFAVKNMQKKVILLKKQKSRPF